MPHIVKKWCKYVLYTPVSFLHIRVSCFGAVQHKYFYRTWYTAQIVTARQPVF